MTWSAWVKACVSAHSDANFDEAEWREHVARPRHFVTSAFFRNRARMKYRRQTMFKHSLQILSTPVFRLCKFKHPSEGLTSLLDHHIHSTILLRHFSGSAFDTFFAPFLSLKLSIYTLLSQTQLASQPVSQQHSILDCSGLC